MALDRETKFKCVICGKLTAGRWPREGGIKGDGSARWPRKHRIDNKICEGNYYEAEWVDVPKKGYGK